MNNWIVRVWQPKNPEAKHVFLLIHGHTGDENSMEIFTRNLPSDSWILSPRGPYPTEEGGYKWISSEQGLTKSFKEFQTSARELDAALSNWKMSFALPDQKINLVGFSQGAVMAFTYALTFPEKINQIAGISGFLPRDTMEFIREKPLDGIPVFIAHGTEDQIVPFERAKETETWLSQAGARVTFCDAGVGHRISANCFRSLAEFFTNM